MCGECKGVTRLNSDQIDNTDDNENIDRTKLLIMVKEIFDARNNVRFLAST